MQDVSDPSMREATMLAILDEDQDAQHVGRARVDACSAVVLVVYIRKGI